MLQSEKLASSLNFDIDRKHVAPFIVNHLDQTKSRNVRVRVSWFIAFCCLSLPILAAGCSTNGDAHAQKLVGKWQLMTTQQISESKDEVDPKLAQKLAQDGKRIDQVSSEGQLMLVEFRLPAVLETSAIQVKKGTWYFKSYSESDQTVTIECQLGLEEPVVTKIRFVSDDIVCMIPPNIAVLEKELLFRRVALNEKGN